MVPAVKTRNMYEISVNDYNKLLRQNITKAYRKAYHNSIDSINQELGSVAAIIGLGDRIKEMAEKEAFITLKDRKENFLNNPTCRLINPAKSNIGRVSKVILEKVNSAVRSQLKANQWRNSEAVIERFNDLSSKQCLTFLMFDIVDFYPSIIENLLEQSLLKTSWNEFAIQFIEITPEDVRVIMHAKRSKGDFCLIG